MSRWGGRHATELLTLLLSIRPHRCVLCGRPIDARLRGTLDPMRPSSEHVIPRSRGGTDELHNLALAHYGCNAGRGNRLPRRPAAIDGRFFSTPAAGSPAPASCFVPVCPEKSASETGA